MSIIYQGKKILKGANRAAGNPAWTSELADLLGQEAGKYVKKRVREKSGPYDTPPNTPKKKKVKSLGRSFAKKNMPRITRQNPINQLANRASMKVRGKKNQKVRSQKKVTVSKSLREKVKKVIAGDSAYGAYYQNYNGAVGMIDPGTYSNYAYVQTYGAITQCNLMYTGVNIPTGSKTWWSNLHYNAGDGIKSKTYIGNMVYFSPAKILNAASVLFNSKALEENYTNTAGNLSTDYTTATGAPAVGGAGAPNVGTLKVRVVNSYVKWRMKNLSQRTVYVTVYNCTSKLKFTTKAPLEVLRQEELTDDSVTTQTFTAFAQAGGTVQSAVVTHPAFVPGASPAFNSTYKTSKMVMVINPGEECTHSIQGPRNYDLDFAKLHANGSSKAGEIYKDTTVACMVSVQVDPVVWNDETSPLISTRHGYLSNHLIRWSTSIPNQNA